MMKRLLLTFAVALLTICSMAQAPAFPGAEGFARLTATGGRGGKIIHVTNLNDSGEGSLRAAISTKGARIVVFDVSGIIHLNSDIEIKNDDLTILGQTAPGDGICIADYSTVVKANNVIIRFLRFRRGNAKDTNEDGDCIWGRQQKNIIIDHCSMSWSIDECASFYDNMNFTMQWCTLGESLNNAGHGKGAHGYGGIWGGRNATFHHNLLIHHTNRTPRLCGSRYGFWNTDAGRKISGDTYDAVTMADGWTYSDKVELDEVQNCVIYNWGTGNGAYGGMGGHHNIVNNYYKYGPATSNKTRVFQCSEGTGNYALPKGVYGHFYINGNYVRDKGANYDWQGVITDNKNATTKDTIKNDTKYGESPTTLHTAEIAFDKVLAYAGASYRRDTVDKRYATETMKATTTFIGSVTKKAGIIDSQEEVGGWPTYEQYGKLDDTDGDGMPDVWETANGLNSNDAADASAYTLDSKGYYTNIEVYANALVEDLVKAQNAGAEESIDEYYPATKKADGVAYYDGSAAKGGYADTPDAPTPPEVESLVWDYSEAAPSDNPDKGLYYGSSVNDPSGTKNGLKGIKLNSTGYAYFEKPAVEGTLTLTIGKRDGTGDYCVDVFRGSLVDGTPVKGDLIATTDVVQESNAVSVEIPADVTGIFIARHTTAEGVLSKIVFKPKTARSFKDFEINLVSLPSEFDTSTLPTGVVFSGTYNSDSHGYRGASITVPVDGTVKFTIGGCQYAKNTFTVTNAAGETLVTLDPKTAQCYHQDKSAITWFYTGDATTLTFNNIQYLPYFKAEAAEVSEVTVTYKDQEGHVLGTKKVFEGEAIGDTPYTEADLTIADGYKFRGWIYANGVKVKTDDPVNGNVTVSASVTAIESVALGTVQTYDLTQANFYPEDHETISVTNGVYYNNHGFNFAAGGSLSVDVAGKAQIVLTLCQYGNGTTITMSDADGKTLKDNIPAIAEADGSQTTVNYDGPATTLTFTFAAQTYLHKVTVYNVENFMEKDSESGYYIVPAGDAASLILAFNAASSEEGAKIFLPNGTYDLGETTLTTISGTNVSLIGESADKTIIRNAPPVSMEGLGKADLLVNTGTGLYMQDLTLKNDLDYYTAGTGRAPTLHDQDTKTICKNVRQLSYQDTYYSHKAGGLFYFDGGEIHGTVDYICGNGTVYFNGVTLVNEKRNSATISANSELYVFNNCTVENNADGYNFGRAWSGTPVCVYLNTTLKDPSRLIATRWDLTGINTDYLVAGEYATKDADGKDITPASNEVIFTKANTKMNTILSDSEADVYSMERILGDWATTAREEAAQVQISNVDAGTAGKITWKAPIADGVLMLCAVSESGTEKCLKIGRLGTEMDTKTIETLLAEPDVKAIAIRAANSRGGFGPSVVISPLQTDGIAGTKVSPDADTPEVIHNLQGVRVTPTGKGVYIINGKKVVR